MAVYSNRDDAEGAISAAAADHDPRLTGDKTVIQCPLPSHSENGSNQGGVTLEVWNRAEREFVVTAKCWAGCDRDEVRNALGLLDPRTDRGEPDHQHTYERYGGEPLIVYRIDASGDRDKQIWNSGGRLAQVKPKAFCEVAATDTLLIVEGELCADTASSLAGYAGVTWPGGTGKESKISRNGWIELCENRDCVLWPDNDAGGIKSMQSVARIIDGHAASVRIVDVSGMQPKGDIRDVDADAAIRMLQDAAAYEAPQHGGAREGSGRKRKHNDACYRDCDDAMVEADVVNAVDNLDSRFRIIQNRLHRVDADGFWCQFSDGSRSALAAAIVELTEACLRCASALSGPVWHKLVDEWIRSGRPQPNQYRAFNLEGIGYRAFTTGADGKVDLREVAAGMLITHKPKRLIGPHTEDWPQTMAIRESGEYIPLMNGWTHATRYQFVRMIAKSLDRDAMFGDDDIINLIGPAGSGKGTLIEQVKALLDDQGVAMPVMKRQGMHWSEDKAFTRNNLVVINEANNPNAEYVQRALAASDSTIEVNEKNEPITQEVARCRIIFVGTRNIVFESATGMGRRITPFISGGESHVDGGTDDEVKRFAVTDGEVTKLFWRLVDSLPDHHRVGAPVDQVKGWKLRVLDDADPIRTWIREFVEVREGVAPTPLRHFVTEYCNHAGLKPHGWIRQRVESALDAMPGVSVTQAAPRRPKSVDGATLIDADTQAVAIVAMDS